MKKAKIIKNGHLNLSNIEIKEDKKQKKFSNIVKVKDWVEKSKDIDFDKYYSDIENAIMEWSIDGTKTAGALTRQIIKILKKKK